MLGGIVSGTNEKLFGTALVLLRIAFGGVIASNVGSVALSQGVTAPWIMYPSLVIAALFVLGLCIRPASIGLLAMLVLVDLVVLPFATVKSLIWPQLLLVSVILMGLSGGLGNAFGLNGLILRNLKNPGKLLKFLFS